MYEEIAIQRSILHPSVIDHSVMPAVALPPEIKIEQLLPVGCRYILPRRELGTWRWSGLIPILFGLGGLAFAVNWFAAAGAGLQQGPAFFQVISALLGIPVFFAMGCVPLAIGLGILFGHSEVEVSSGRLCTIERVGMLRWRRARPIDEVQRFVVGNVKNVREGASQVPASLRDLSCIRIEWVQKKLWLAAPGYPRAWVIAMADALAEQCHLATAPESLLVDAPAAARIEVIEDSLEPGTTERLTQPSTSKIVLEETADGLTFNVPPAGLMKGSAGLFFFALIWLGFMVFFTGGVFFAANGPQLQKDGIWVMLGIFAFISLFWAVGIGMMVAAVNMGGRRAGIVVDGERLMVLKTSIFGSKTEEWQRDALRAIRVGPSGMESNDVPVLELQIHPKSGKKFGLLSGRDTDELEWMATHLRRSLGMPQRADNGAINLPDVTQQPTKSRVVYEPLPDGLMLSVPRAGLGAGCRGMWVFAFVWNVFMTIFTSIFVAAGAMHDGSAIFLCLFLSVFWCIGIALLATALHMSLRTAELAVSGGRLFVLRKGLLGKSKREFEPEAISCVRAGPSTTSVNGQPLIELQIVPREGSSLNLLNGRDQEELAWMATLLRQSLGVPAEVVEERRAV
jgi:hypothetical protein